MSDPWNDLEAELRGLQPRRPSPQLLARIERALAEPAADRQPRARTWLPWPQWLPWAVAFFFALVAGGALWIAIRAGSRTERATPMATARLAPAPYGTPPAVFQPLGASRYPVVAYDEGLTRLQNGWPARRVVERSVDVYTWRNPHTDASVQWSVPCEAVRLVPLDAY